MFCMQCGAQIPENSLFCTSCGAKVEEINFEDIIEENQDVGTEKNVEEQLEEQPNVQVEQPTKEKTKIGAGQVVGNIFLAIFFSAFAVIFLLALFLYFLASDVSMPSLGIIDGEQLTEILNSWYILVATGILLLIPCLLIIINNKKRARVIFLVFGISFISVAAIILSIGIGAESVITFLPASFQKIFLKATVVYKELSYICSITIFTLGCIFTSIYSCIRNIKGE